MKLKIIIGAIIASLACVTFAVAAPSWTNEFSLVPLVDSTYTLGTTTRTWLNLYTDQICLNGDCQTSWAGGSADGTFSTTSANYWSTFGLAFSTTSTNYWETQQAARGADGTFSTTSANYWSTFGLAFSTTSNNYWSSVGLGFSTTSAAYWKTQNTFEALTAGDGLTRTADDFDCDTASGSAFGCITAANWTTFNMKVATSGAETRGQLAAWGSTNGSPATLYSVATGTISATSPVTVTAGRAAIGGSAVFAWDFSVANTWTGLQTFNTGGIISNASSTFLGGYFPALNRFGLASTSCSALWGGCIGTSTVMGNAQFNILIASSTANTATVVVNWDNGNQFRHILQQNTLIVLNSTSSNPRDGAKYILDLCQDGTGSRTVTFGSAAHLVWLTPEGTTTVKSTANTMTSIGMTYDGRLGRYLIRATSTAADVRACLP